MRFQFPKKLIIKYKNLMKSGLATIGQLRTVVERLAFVYNQIIHGGLGKRRKKQALHL
jgi:hypothetical protein